MSPGPDRLDEDFSDEVSISHFSDTTHGVTIKQDDESFGKKETRAVSRTRLLFLAILLLAASIVLSFTFVYIRTDENKEFNNRFDVAAQKIVENFHESVEQRMTAVDSISVLYTSRSIDTGVSFPNVTLPHLEIMGANARIASQSVLLQYAPLVTEEQRPGWEAYAEENKDFLYKSYFAEEEARGQQDARFERPIPNGHHPTASKTSTESRPIQDSSDPPVEGSTNFTALAAQVFGESHTKFRNEIWSVGADGKGYTKPPGTGPYLPFWGMSPTIFLRSIMNADTYDIESDRATYDEVIRSKEAVIGAIASLEAGDDDNLIQVLNLYLSLGQYRQNQEENHGEPFSLLTYPVFDTFDVSTRKVSGILTTTLYWHHYFSDVLPEDMTDVICVIESSLGQFITYRLDGSTGSAEFVGSGDLHDKRYDEMEVTADVSEYVQSRASVEHRSYTTVDLNGEYNNFILRVYPSKKLQRQFFTWRPFVFTATMGIVFLFTSACFILYDRFVERRQTFIFDRAVRSNAVVTSLYPKNIRDRILEEQNVVRRESTSFTPTSSIASNISEGNEKNSRGPEKQIAEKFLHTTVSFADIAGFTSWSSKRSPDQVFQLLGTTYGCFDSIAKKRKVFKVETIGDCYMAVTGLPTTQEDHAIRMAKFSRECMHKMNNLTGTVFAARFGVEDALSLRIGLHSGPVTAGVLRGDKSRFQLFGDTVNTASRMESNGKAGKIHLSEGTAKLIIESGYEKWLVQRREKIEVKGKGEMQTFWFNTQSNGDPQSASRHNRLRSMSSDSDDSPQANKNTAASSSSDTIIDGGDEYDIMQTQ